MNQKSLKKTTSPADLEEATNRTDRVAKLGELYASMLGLNDGNVALQIINQAMNGPSWCTLESDPGRLSTTLGMLTEIGPKGAMETLLAVQMIAVHNAALMFLKHATIEGQTFEAAGANVVRAVGLMQLFNEQIKVMARLKGKTGQQKVTVEHVHVNQGGQAIVGAVLTAPRRGKNGADEKTRPKNP